MKHVYIFVKGGLGNQMFEAALGVVLEHTLGATVRFLTDTFQGDPYGRSYLLDSFPALRGRATSTAAVPGLKVLVEEQLPGRTAAEKFAQIAAVLESEPVLALDGYWQDEGYWNGRGDLVRELLRPDVSERTREAGAKLRSVGAVGLHVRRGDYGHHGLARSEYYVRALEAIRAETGVGLAIYATDEPNFCRFIFRGIPNLMELGGNSKMPFDDFHMLASCRHYVISNSSFSWWAAFLGEEPDSIVYAPQPWCMFDPQLNPVPARWRSVGDAVQRQ